MKKRRREIAVFVAMCLSLGCVVPTFAASTPLLSWYLVDSSKHLDWTGSTKYSRYFNYAVDTWNNYKEGVIRKDTAFTMADVEISDFEEKSNTAGRTSSTGTIKFNTYVLDKYYVGATINHEIIENVCLHELGHALGLAHNYNTDVMYMYISEMTSLSINDKASYDKSYARYK